MLTLSVLLSSGPLITSPPSTTSWANSRALSGDQMCNDKWPITSTGVCCRLPAALLGPKADWPLLLLFKDDINTLSHTSFVIFTHETRVVVTIV